MTDPSQHRFTWWHRDEVQVVFVYVLITFFFCRSTVLQVLLVAGSLSFLAVLWILRWWKSAVASGSTTTLRPLLLRILRSVPPYPWERSRLVLSVTSVLVVGVLFAHRLQMFLADDVISHTGDASFATPLDLYWILFLGWYLLVWIAIAFFLFNKWKHQTNPTDHRFWEGLVGSMFFYHGLPTKGRIVTFAASFFLGGLPTALAVQIAPDDPFGRLKAALLIVPVAGLIMFGAWFASRWVGTTESGEV